MPPKKSLSEKPPSEDQLDKALTALILKRVNDILGDDDSVRDPFVKKLVDPSVAGLKPFNEQCFLLEYIRPITKAKAEMDAPKARSERSYTRIGR